MSDKEDYKKITNIINNLRSQITTNCFLIGKQLDTINQFKLYELDNYSSVLDYAEKKFQFKRSTTYNLMAIYKRFYFDDCYHGFNYSQLLEMLSIDDDNINKIKPTMTIKEIKALKLAWKMEKNPSKRLESNTGNIVIKKEDSEKEIIEENPVKLEEVTNVLPEPVEIENKVIPISMDSSSLIMLNNSLDSRLDLHKDLLKYLYSELDILCFGDFPLNKIKDKLNILTSDIDLFLKQEKLPKKLKFFNEVI